MSSDDIRDRGTTALGCEGAQDRILSAGPDELRGKGGGPLARHLETCSVCRSRAERVLSAVGVLNATLEARAAAGARPVDEVLRRVRAAVGQQPAPLSPKAPRRAVRWTVVGSLAAAALAVGVALWPRGPETSADTPPGPTARRTVTAPGALVAGSAGLGVAGGSEGRPWDTRAETNELKVAADRRFALMKTDDPSISVVWFY